MNAFSRNWQIARNALAAEKVRLAGVNRVDETDFLPAALEIVEAPVSPTARLTAWVLMIGLVLTICWITFGRIDVVASAPGRIIPVDSVKIIQPAETGTVRAIRVRDGQYVRKGQVLIELDPTLSSADEAQARKALQSAELDAARDRAILAALDGKALHVVAPADTPAEIAAVQNALATAQLAQIRASAAGHAADREAAVAARGEARVQAAKLTETLPLLDEQIAANEALLAKGYVSKLKVIEMRRQRLAAAKDRDVALETVHKSAAQMAAANSQANAGIAEARAQILVEEAKAEADARLRREELSKALQKSRFQGIVSPVDGVVTQLTLHTVGGTVEAAKPIMSIVPSAGAVVAEVRVLNRDVGFVHAGQAVALKIEAFPFTRYGTVPGRVITVSSDAVEDEKLGLVYVVRVALNRRTLEADGESRLLTPGMGVTADIATGHRTIASYLFDPINEARLSAGREK